ncbi:MT-A70 family protein [Oxytricha trifallax]|uniref:mRNA m(6)A methyltransferase n=1 Tax=Oxytricha trifallax TaxID=1172189 RepID=A0A073HZD6_9SPIT|nr:MT-A70 family protein [Oxytricha trifallax]
MLGVFQDFPLNFQLQHMKKCSLVDKSLIKNKQRLYDEKEIDRWNYGEMRSLKQIQDPKQSELRVPEFIYEVKGGYICQAWINYFRQQFIHGLPIKLQSDVRNDYLWENLIAAMLKVVGALFMIVVQDNPWKGQKALPYEYLSNKSLRQIPLNQIQEEGIIFYWTLFNTQKEGFKILQEQGYEVVKVLEWVKLTNKGNLINSINPEYSIEYCLIGIKGSLYENLIKDIPDQIIAERRQHSEKPQEFWSMINLLFGEEYRLEIFTRSNSEKMNTVHIGNEIKGEEAMRITKFI